MHHVVAAVFTISLLASPLGVHAQSRTGIPELTLAQEFAAGLDGFASPSSTSGAEPEVVRMQLERPRIEGRGWRIGGRWLVTVGSALLASGVVAASVFRPFTCWDTGERVRSTAYGGGITAAVGMAFLIGGGIRLARSSPGNQRQLGPRRLGYGLLWLILASSTMAVLTTGYVFKALGCD